LDQIVPSNRLSIKCIMIHCLLPVIAGLVIAAATECTGEECRNDPAESQPVLLQLTTNVHETSAQTATSANAVKVQSRAMRASSTDLAVAATLWLEGLMCLGLVLLRVYLRDGKAKQLGFEDKDSSRISEPPAAVGSHDVDAADDATLSAATTFVEILHKKATQAGTKCEEFALVWDMDNAVQRRLTYQEFAMAVASGAAAMTKAGVLAEDRVAFLAKGSTHFFVGLLSTQAVGAAPVLLNWRQPTQVLIGCVKDTNAATLMLGAPYHEVGCAIADESPEVQRVLAFDDINPPFKTPFGKIVSLWKWSTSTEGSDLRILTQTARRRSDEAVIFFTSGSTGQPKPVLHTYETLLWTAQHFRYPPDATLSMALLPNFHVIQTVQNFLIPLTRGLRVAIHGADETASMSSPMLLAAAEALKPDVIDTVPFIMAEWSELEAEKLKPLTHCKWVQSGGAPLATAVAERLLAAGVKARTHYGQTEAPAIQLCTIPGPTASELSLFLPPWPCASVSLRDEGNEDAEKGELIIRGIGGSSPGYLKDGKLIPGSSRKDEKGRHRTSDVFCWVTASNGTRCLKHCMRTDDVILLSTGEMFNPVQMEASILDYAIKTCGLKATRSVVLGHDRSAAFLLVELSPEEETSAASATVMLEAGVEEANKVEVEYGRIKKGHLLVLAPRAGDKVLPTSIKGNVVRKLAEDEFSEQLTELGKAADAAAMQDIDWDQLETEAKAAGYDDVQKYLLSEGSGRMAELGMDSLGIKSVTTKSSQEVDKAVDNVNAWMSGTVLMLHWYKDLVFIDQFALSGDTMFRKMMNVLQAASLTVANQNGLTISMACFIFVIGWSEQTRKSGDRSVLFDQRMAIYVLLLFTKKFFIMPIVFWSSGQGCQSSNTWFFYSLIFGKIAVFLLQGLKISKAARVAVAALPLLVVTLLVSCVESLDGGSGFQHNMMVTLPAFNELAAAVFNAIVNPHTYVAIRSIPCPQYDGSGCNEIWPASGDSTFILRSVDLAWSCDMTRFIAFDFVVLSYIAPFVLGYEYGTEFHAYVQKAHTAFLRSTKTEGTAAAGKMTWILLGGLFGVMAMFMAMQIACGDALALSTGVEGAIWNLGTVFLSMALVISIAIIAPFRAQRMGSSALGLYILAIFWASFNYAWVEGVAMRMFDAQKGQGLAGQWYLMTASVILLIGWPYLYGYLFGPLLQKVVLNIVNFCLWLFSFFTAPISALNSGADCLLNMPSAFLKWSVDFLKGFWEAICFPVVTAVLVTFLMIIVSGYMCIGTSFSIVPEANMTSHAMRLALH